jgi:hypothetical protein
VRRNGIRCSNSSPNVAFAIGSPQISNLSTTESRCGDVNWPVVNPCAHAIAAMRRAVVVFPFVPVTWIVG